MHFFCFFQTFFIIKTSTSHIYFYHGHLALSPLTLLLKSQAVLFHWNSHIPSSSAPLEQVLNKQQCTTSAVTAAWISNCFFVCLLLKPSLKLSWLDWLKGVCKNLYLTFHSSQIPDCKDRETRRNMLFFVSLFLFPRKRDLIPLVRHTVWSPVTVGSLHPMQ